MEGTVKITGLWKQKDKNGNTYLSGSLSPVSRVLVMPNTYKKEDRDPDYFFYLGANQEKKGAPKPKQDTGDDL